ncbi:MULTISPECIES: 2'-5' RNA ligase family protein [unclassified Ochrobactrum]|uniref:2'-5' RNA ligase family protein n=1 Tax=unclassified Ochrobactrum TaxID=239106 RepID=UPI000DEF3992|nr:MULTISPECIES: 2'-5' RNA ligase family protein [unclassified Ochrobactrum]MBQ0707493.1 2'-5' RNA ligase family protein [Ochrobactrum sp. AP1BH01-1]
MTFHSIWLRPALDDFRFLESIVTELAGRFASPLFEPHATLIPDMKRSADELLQLVLSLAAGRKPLDVRIEDVTGTEAYFRSFYAALQKTPALIALKQDTLGISGEKDITTFLPHVSLAYGVADKALRETEMARLRRSLAGRNLRFDRMVIVSSSSETPIDQWIVKHEIYLAG